MINLSEAIQTARLIMARKQASRSEACDVAEALEALVDGLEREKLEDTIARVAPLRRAYAQDVTAAIRASLGLEAPPATTEDSND